VPRFRLNEEAQRAQAAEARIAELESSNTELSTQLQSAQATAQTWQHRHQIDVPMLSRATDFTDFNEPEVRDFFGQQYRSYATGAGEQAETFDKWLDGQIDKPSPLLRPFLTRAAPEVAKPGLGPTPKAPKPKAVNPPPKVDTGAAPAATSAPVTYTADEIAQIRQRGEFKGEVAKTILTQWIAEGTLVGDLSMFAKKYGFQV